MSPRAVGGLVDSLKNLEVGAELASVRWQKVSGTAGQGHTQALVLRKWKNR